MLLAYTQMKGINSEESSKATKVRKVNGEWELNASETLVRDTSPALVSSKVDSQPTKAMGLLP